MKFRQFASFCFLTVLISGDGNSRIKFSLSQVPPGLNKQTNVCLSAILSASQYTSIPKFIVDQNLSIPWNIIGIVNRNSGEALIC